MEKGTPHSSLSVVKSMLAAGKVRSTMTALAGGAALGFDFAGLVGVIQALTSADFLQEHDHAYGPPGLAGRVPPKHSSRRGLPETDGH